MFFSGQKSRLEISSELEPLEPGRVGKTKLSSVFKSQILMLRPSIAMAKRPEPTQIVGFSLDLKIDDF